MLEEDERRKQEATRSGSDEKDTSSHVGQNEDNGKAVSTEAEVKVPVNEDYLFDVDIDKRELAPAYWLGPVYDVRRGTWFFVGTLNYCCVLH